MDSMLNFSILKDIFSALLQAHSEEYSQNHTDTGPS